MDPIDELKIILQEDEYPYFTDDKLLYYYEKNSMDLNATAYHCLMLKSQNSSISISGLSVGDSSKYWAKIAIPYKPNHSRLL